MFSCSLKIVVKKVLVQTSPLQLNEIIKRSLIFRSKSSSGKIVMTSNMEVSETHQNQEYKEVTEGKATIRCYAKDKTFYNPAQEVNRDIRYEL